MAGNQDSHGIDADTELQEIDGIADKDMPTQAGLDDELGHVFRELFGGWENVADSAGALQQARMENVKLMKKEANIFRETFATATGRQCLKIMREMTLDTSPYPVEANLPIDAITALVIAHDAQCNFVRAIMAAIGQAQQLEENEDKGQDNDDTE